MAKLASKSRPASERIGVVVLGMHRSGTSALTRVLSLLGCDLPKTLMPTASSNEAGHWESLPIAQLNDEILKSAGSHWHDWLAVNPGWASSPKAGEFKEKAIAAIGEQFGSSRLFVLKDPRICRIAPFWIDALETAGIRPVFVMPIRNPLEVAESLEDRNGIDPALGQLLWLRHVLEAEIGSRGLPRYHTSYAALLTGWPSLASAAQAELGISWPRLSPLASEEIDEFLSNRLRHHRASSASVSDNPLLSAWLRETFDVFGRWADSGEEAADHATLDRIRTELDSAAPAFSRLISAGERSSNKAKALEADLSEAGDRLAQAEVAAVAQQEQVEGLERQLTEARAALTTSQADADQKQEQIGELAGRLSEAQSELTRSQVEVQSQRAALEESRGELSHTQSELAQRRAEADDARAELQQLEQRLAEAADATAQRLAEAEDEARQRREAEQRLAEADQARHVAIERATRLERELNEERSRANAELQRLRSEKGTVEGRLAERFSELALLTRLLAEKESAIQASDERAAWLREVSALLVSGSAGGSLKSRLVALMPGPIRFKKQQDRLRRSGIFDPDAYLAAHPDVAEAGMDPLWHYIHHGIAEGRQLHTEPKEESRANNEKL